MRPGAVLEEPSALAFFKNKLTQLASQGEELKKEDSPPHLPAETALGAGQENVTLYFDNEAATPHGNLLRMTAPKTSRRPSIDIRNDIGEAHNWMRLINALRPLE